MVEDLTAKIKSDIDQQRAEALMQVKQNMEDESRAMRSEEINDRAGLINAKRNAPVVAQGDAAKDAYRKAEAAGAIDAEGAKLGEAASESFVKDNAKPVNYMDKLEAASELGYVDPDKMAKIQLDERRANRQEAIAGRKLIYDEAVLNLKDRHEDNNERRIDALIAKSSGEGKSKEDKWQFAMKALQDDISGFMSDKKAAQKAMGDALPGAEKEALQDKIKNLNARISLARKAKAKIGKAAGYELPDYDVAVPEKEKGGAGASGKWGIEPWK